MRQGLYGCLYTARSPAGAAGEYRKHFVRRGLRRDRDLVCLAVEIEYVLCGARSHLPDRVSSARCAVASR